MTLNKTIREKDLGVKVDNKLNFSNHTEIQVNKANRILHQIKRSYDILDLCGTCKANPWVQQYPLVPYATEGSYSYWRTTKTSSKLDPDWELSNFENEERLRQLKLTTKSKDNPRKPACLFSLSMQSIRLPKE